MKKQIKQVVFVGSKQIGFLILNQMFRIAEQKLQAVITIDDRSDSRSFYNDFSKFCKTNKLPFIVVKNRVDFNEKISQLKPDFCLVCGWYWIIEKKLLDQVPFGFAGLHGSLLPKYRGGAPLVWAKINGEKESGMSLFYFDEGMDSGDIIGQEKFSIMPSDTIKELINKSQQAAVNLIIKNYSKILSGSAITYKQDEGKATYCAQRTSLSGRLIWNLPSEKILNLVKAQTDPYPGAFSYLDNDDRKIIIWEAHLDKRVYYGFPGQIVEITNDYIAVVCGDNRLLLITLIERGHSGRVKPREIINNYKKSFRY